MWSNIFTGCLEKHVNSFPLWSQHALVQGCMRSLITPTPSLSPQPAPQPASTRSSTTTILSPIPTPSPQPHPHTQPCSHTQDAHTTVHEEFYPYVEIYSATLSPFLSYCKPPKTGRSTRRLLVVSLSTSLLTHPTQTGQVIGKVTGNVETQLIAHDKKVHEIAFTWAGAGSCLFSSVGSGGSMTMFDLMQVQQYVSLVCTYMYIQNMWPALRAGNGWFNP